MKVSLTRNSAIRLGLVAAVTGLLFTTPLSAQEKSKEKEKKSYQKDFDKELESLEKARISMENHRDFDLKKMEADIKRAMEKIDMQKAQMMADEALKSVDFAQIEKQVSDAMVRVAEAQKEISTETQENIRKALEKAKQTFEEQKRFNQKDIEEQLEKARKQIEQSKDQIKLSQQDFQRSFKEAAKSIEEAKKDVKNYQEMIYAMEAEGLLDTQKDYTVEYKESKLTINGNEQPDSVTDKYKKYFRKDPITIKKEDGKMDIRNKY
ncbi:MAG: hypothetical protein ACTHMC_05175 [Pseudobacter sp.]|uniref:hypothetical protein n=1 Tax=Pseudobacter sp. TaxID=2045420 RepID=UPI003F81E5D2